MLERDIVRAILTYLNRLPCCYARKVHGGPHGAGWPDVIGCHNGCLLALEVKRPGGKATPLQAAELAKWRAAGAVCGVVTDVEQVKNLLDREHQDREQPRQQHHHATSQ